MKAVTWHGNRDVRVDTVPDPTIRLRELLHVRAGPHTQCETTQVRDQGMGAALFGYTKLYGQVPGGQAEFLRVPQAQLGPIKVPEGPLDDRFVYLSDVLPSAWQAVEYAPIQKKQDGTIKVLLKP